MKKSTLLLASILLCLMPVCLYADEMNLDCDAFRLLLNANGTTQAIQFPGAKQAARRLQNPDPLFTVELQESVYGIADGKRRRIPLDSVREVDSTIVFSNTEEPSVRMIFESENKNDYLTLRLVSVETPAGEHATRMNMELIRDLRIFPLNAEVIRNRNESIVFAAQLQRNPATPFGAVAIWHPETKEKDDEILYQVWVNENLPHPKIEDAWTVPRAKQWVADYITKFSRYSEIYITGENLQEL